MLQILRQFRAVKVHHSQQVRLRYNLQSDCVLMRHAFAFSFILSWPNSSKGSVAADALALQAVHSGVATIKAVALAEGQDLTGRSLYTVRTPLRQHFLAL